MPARSASRAADVRGDLVSAKRFIGVRTQEGTFDGDFTVEQNLPITHPMLAILSAANPLYHLAQTYRGLLLRGPVVGHLTTLALLTVLMVVVLVPLLLRRRVLGD